MLTHFNTLKKQLLSAFSKQLITYIIKQIDTKSLFKSMVGNLLYICIDTVYVHIVYRVILLDIFIWLLLMFLYLKKIIFTLYLVFHCNSIQSGRQRKNFIGQEKLFWTVNITIKTLTWLTLTKEWWNCYSWRYWAINFS